MAYSLVIVDPQQVCEALHYLVNEKQEDDGGFREDNPVYTTTMTVHTLTYTHTHTHTHTHRHTHCLRHHHDGTHTQTETHTLPTVPP